MFVTDYDLVSRELQPITWPERRTPCREYGSKLGIFRTLILLILVRGDGSLCSSVHLPPGTIYIPKWTVILGTQPQLYLEMYLKPESDWI